MKVEKINDIITYNRQKGNSTWIVKSAIKNPNCVIVAHDSACAYDLKCLYYSLLKKQPFYKKIIWKLFGRSHPRFMSIENDFRGINLPVIFDNSALF